MNQFETLRAKLTHEPPVWAERNIRIVALGDSVTQGLGMNPLMLGTEVYHEVFRRQLIACYPTRSFSLVNAGVGGDTTGGGLARLQRDVLDAQPDLVTICFGLNDSGGGRNGEDMTLHLSNGINHPDAWGHRILADALGKTFLAAVVPG